MKTLYTACMIVLIAAGQSLRAQNTDEDSLSIKLKVYKFPETIITAPRVTLSLKEAPFSASVVDSDFIRTVPRSVAVDEPLKLVPGVKIDNQANGERVHLSIRGQGILTERGIRGIKILVDGIPLNDPTGFAPDFYDVDFTAVDRIEVLRGPAASLYGGSASGGIINILTQNPVDTPLFSNARVIYGSNNFWKGFGQVGGRTQERGSSLSLREGRTSHEGSTLRGWMMSFSDYLRIDIFLVNLCPSILRVYR